jgi:hypothetical protein
MNILINFASRSRPAQFHACMDNLRRCFTNYRVALKVDRTDPTLREYLSKAYPEILLYLGYSDSKVHAINRDIPLYDWDIIINTSDDIMWKPGAGEDIIRNYEPDTFLHFPEPYAESQAAKAKRASICICSIMDRAYFDRFGYIYHPDYRSLWSDNEATEVAKSLGRYKFIDKVIFEHMHPAAGKAKKDDQYRLTESFGAADKKTFFERKIKGFV